MGFDAGGNGDGPATACYCPSCGVDASAEYERALAEGFVPVFYRGRVRRGAARGRDEHTLLVTCIRGHRFIARVRSGHAPK